MSLPDPAAYKIQTLWQRMVKLDLSAGGPPWPISVWDDDTNTWQSVAMEGLGFAGTYLWDDAGTLLVDAHGDLITVI